MQKGLQGFALGAPLEPVYTTQPRFLRARLMHLSTGEAFAVCGNEPGSYVPVQAATDRKRQDAGTSCLKEVA